MIKRYAPLALFISLAFILTSWCAHAQQDKEEIKSRLSELRTKKAEMIDEYNANQHKINTESEARLTKIKTEFRIARDECLREKDDKSRALRKEHEGKLKLLLREEEELIRKIGLDSATDLAKAKRRK